MDVINTYKGLPTHAVGNLQTRVKALGQDVSKVAFTDIFAQLKSRGNLDLVMRLPNAPGQVLSAQIYSHITGEDGKISLAGIEEGLRVYGDDFRRDERMTNSHPAIELLEAAYSLNIPLLARRYESTTSDLLQKFADTSDVLLYKQLNALLDELHNGDFPNGSLDALLRNEITLFDLRTEEKKVSQIFKPEFSERLTKAYTEASTGLRFPVSANPSGLVLDTNTLKDPLKVSLTLSESVSGGFNGDYQPEIPVLPDR